MKNKKGGTKKTDNKNALTISEFRRELGVPLIVAKKLINWGEVEYTRAVDGTLRVAKSEVEKISKTVRHPVKKAKLFFRALGPGLITGASDDDPSGIGTYSSVGARFGLAILWTAAWLLPIMLAVQEVCARIGIVTNRGLAGVLQKHYRKKFVVAAIFLLVLANVINIGADLGAMAASLEMLIGMNFFLGVIFFSIITIIFEVFIGYHLYVKFLKWMSFSVLSYIVAGLIIRPEWGEIFGKMFIPNIQFSKEYLFAMVAVFGTTITPYLFFWQASEEVEENKLAVVLLGKRKKKNLRLRIAKMRTDVSTGMILANVVFLFIVLTTAQVLFNNGIYEINSAQEAAEALRPLAGNKAYLLFALGIIGTGLLAVPVLAGSGAYAIAEIMKWKEGLELKFLQAKGFYLVIAFSVIFGMALNFLRINPIEALYWSAFINGIIALPLLVIIMKVGDDKKIMGHETNPRWVRAFGWAAVVFMAVMVAVLFFWEIFG